MISLILLVMLLMVGTSLETRVELEDYISHGTVIFEEGIAQTITCTVEDPNEESDITWKVGERLLEPRACDDGDHCLAVSIEDVDSDYENSIQQTLTFVPSFEDDGQSLSCEYGTSHEQSMSDSIRLIIYKQSVSISDLNAVKEGEPLNIKVIGTIYPPAREMDFTWKVEDQQGKHILGLHPGEKDEFLPYQALDLQDLGSHKYKLEFFIPFMTETESKYRYSLEINRTKPLTWKKVLHPRITFLPKDKLKEQPEKPQKDIIYYVTDDDPISTTDKNNLHQSPQEPDTTQSGLGLAIIIGLLILCLALCIVFCCVRKRRKEQVEKASGDNRGAFTIVKDPQPHNV